MPAPGPSSPPGRSGLGRELLRMGVLHGTGELAEPDPGQPFFVRRSCCLYYRLPTGGKCGDCALITPKPATSSGRGPYAIRRLMSRTVVVEERRGARGDQEHGPEPRTCGGHPSPGGR